MEALIKSVIPAKLVLECLNRGAGIHLDLKRGFIESKWIPAFAGMTIYGLNQSFLKQTPSFRGRYAPPQGTSFGRNPEPMGFVA